MLLLSLFGVSLLPVSNGLSLSEGDDENDEVQTNQEQNRRSLLLLSPRYANRQPLNAFERVVVCIDNMEPDCDDSIQFSSDVTPDRNAFRFQPNNTAGAGIPTTLQGVFWMQQGIGGSVLTSFAASRSGGGLDTGVLGEDDGIAYRRRPIGDHSWAFALEPNGEMSITESIARAVDIVYDMYLRKGTSMTFMPLNS